jgi:hypothetical protein
MVLRLVRGREEHLSRRPYFPAPDQARADYFCDLARQSKDQADSNSLPS